MSKLNFSKGKFNRFISSKGFYVALAVCLMGAGGATWLAVDRTINSIENQNNQMIESESRFSDFPQFEEAEKKQLDLPKPSPAPSSSSSTSSSAPEPSSKPSEPSEQPEASEPLPTLSYTLPVKGNILSEFSKGELVKNITLGDWRTHDGVDIAADKGTEVLAAADGTVSDIKSDPLWGTVMTISHPDGNETIYAGLDKNVPVAVGDTVLVRQVIGRLDGVPCEISEKSHLHFAMRRENKWADPLDMIAKQQ